MKTAFRNIGQNRGKSRLWIEGEILSDAGLPHGAPWVLVASHGGLLVRKVSVEPGQKKAHGGLRVRRIAGTVNRPVIDISGSGLGDVAKMERVALHYIPAQGQIAVRNAANTNATQ